MTDERDEMDESMDESMNESMNESVAKAARLMRTEIPVRSAWRDALLSRIESDGEVSRRSRRWTIPPVVAIAAGVLLVLLGAAGATLVSRASSRSTAATLLSSATPMVRFVYVAPGATRVSVVGDFNQWNPTAVPLRRLNDGTWIADVPLMPGRYAYAFVVDGKLEADPNAPRAADSDFGVANSILMVRGS